MAWLGGIRGESIDIVEWPAGCRETIEGHYIGVGARPAPMGLRAPAVVGHVAVSR